MPTQKGRLGAVNFKELPGGKYVANFTVAENTKNPVTGETKAHWHKFTAWGDLAKKLNNDKLVGRTVTIEYKNRYKDEKPDFVANRIWIEL